MKTNPSPTLAQHTPGPLIVREAFAFGPNRYTVEKVDGDLRSVLATLDHNLICPEHGGTSRGNAILYAAAPALLAALEELELIDPNNVLAVLGVQKRARAAILAAKGGAA